MKSAWLVLIATACGDSSKWNLPPDAKPDSYFDTFDEACGGSGAANAALGPRGQACFLIGFFDDPRDEVIAQRAGTGMFGWARIEHPVASATSEPPGLFTITGVTWGDHPDGNSNTFSVALTADQAGDGDVVLRDADGAEIDRITLHSRASDHLALDGNLAATTPLVLAGEITTLHVTTETAGEITVGTGAVALTPSGGVVAVTSADAPYLDAFGDTAFIRVDASGAVHADAPDATVDTNITAVAASALTGYTVAPTALSFAHDDSKIVAIGANALGTPVYGPRCTWTNTGGLSIELTSSIFDAENLGLGNPAVYHYKVKGPAGDYMPVCTLPGGLTINLPVHVS